MAEKQQLTRSEIKAIQARIGSEPAKDLAEFFEVHESTIYRWTRGMKRACRRYSRAAVSDRELLSMASRMKQKQIAYQLGVTPAAICARLKNIREKGPRRNDQHFYQARSNWRRRAEHAGDQARH